MSATSGTVFPWRDDALLPGESLYALWNKLAWFASTDPANLLRQCRATDGKCFTAPTQLAYASPASWTTYLQQVTVAPVIRGLRLFNALRFRVLSEAVEVSAEWCSPYLRVCDLCIAGGVHMRIHQHLAVARCPIHDHRSLRSACTECGHDLEYISRNRHRAFSCANCGCGLLRDEVIRFGFDDAFVERNARANAKCRKWLRRLHAMPAHCGPLIRKAGQLESAAPDSDPRILALAALTRDATDLPQWLRRHQPKDCAVSLAKVDPGEATICHAIRTVARMEELGIKRIPATKRTLDPWEKGERTDERMVARHYHRTIMRVASCFVRQVGAKHHTCIDIPCQIAGESLANILLGWQWHVLDCCPIGVGFWLWRLQSWTRFTHILQTGPTACTRITGHAAFGPSSSPLCYAIERSRLHACILVAHRCRELWQKTGQPLTALRILDEWAQGTGAPAPPRRSRLCFKGAERAVAFLRLDASSLIERTACLGDAALQDWQFDSVGAMVSLRQWQENAGN